MPITPSNWTYKKLITIDQTKVSGSLTNYPVLINIKDINLRDHTNINRPNIIFTERNRLEWLFL